MSRKKSNKHKIPKSQRPSKKFIPVALEIRDKQVKILKLSPSGVVKSYAERKIQTEAHPDNNPVYISNLTDTIKEAMKAAKVNKNQDCAVIVDCSEAVIRRFSYPANLPLDAIQLNLKSDMATYLPGNTRFEIGSESLQKRIVREEGTDVEIQDVLGAAVPTSVTVPVSHAINKAGLNLVRMDIRPNSRNRLVSRYNEVAESSYGILELTRKPNLTLYVNGCFSSTRILSFYMEEGESVEAALSRSSLSLMEETIFSVEFTRYKESVSIENLLLIAESGNEMDKVVKSMNNALDATNIRLHKTNVWLRNPDLNDNHFIPFLNAYSAAIPSTMVSSKYMMDLKTEVVTEKGKNSTPVGIFAGAVLSAGILGIMSFIMLQEASSLEQQVSAYQTRLAMQPFTEAHLTALSDQVNLYRARINDLEGFYTENLSARVLLPVVYNAHFPMLTSVTSSDGLLVLHLYAVDFVHVAAILEYFREHPLFINAATTSVYHAEDGGAAAVNIVLTLVLERGIGER